MTIVAVVVFSNLSDIKRAQLTLKFLGLHEENVSKFSEIADLIKENDFTLCSELSNLKSYQVSLIEDFINIQNPYFPHTERRKITDAYAETEEGWNSGCQPNSLPSQKFEYALFTENALIICSYGGGFASSPWFEFFEINSGKLNLIGVVNLSTLRLFDVALMMRFSPDLIEWKSDAEKYKDSLGLF